MTDDRPADLRYSERALWDAPAPTQAEMRVVLARLARVRARAGRPDVAEEARRRAVDAIERSLTWMGFEGTRRPGVESVDVEELVDLVIAEIEPGLRGNCALGGDGGGR